MQREHWQYFSIPLQIKKKPTKTLPLPPRPSRPPPQINRTNEYQNWMKSYNISSFSFTYLHFSLISIEHKLFSQKPLQ